MIFICANEDGPLAFLSNRWLSSMMLSKIACSDLGKKNSIKSADSLGRLLDQCRQSVLP